MDKSTINDVFDLVRNAVSTLKSEWNQIKEIEASKAVLSEFLSKGKVI